MLQTLLVGCDAGGAWGAALSRGFGPPRLRSFTRVPFAEGALEPGPLDANLRRAPEVHDALVRVAGALDAGRTPVVLVLPDGLARVAWLRPPAGVAPQEFARYRLLGSLPFPAEEAIVNAQAAGSSGVVAAVIRRRVVAEYEEALAAAGLRHERVDLAPLAALAALRRDPPAGPTVDVVLSDAAVTLAALEGPAVRLVRTRRRDRGDGEAARLAAEVDRTAAVAGLRAVEARVVGSGARALLAAWAAAGRRARAGWDVEGPFAADGLETAGLGAALA